MYCRGSSSPGTPALTRHVRFCPLFSPPPPCAYTLRRSPLLTFPRTPPHSSSAIRPCPSNVPPFHLTQFHFPAAGTLAGGSPAWTASSPATVDFEAYPPPDARPFNDGAELLSVPMAAVSRLHSWVSCPRCGWVTNSACFLAWDLALRQPAHAENQHFRSRTSHAALTYANDRAAMWLSCQRHSNRSTDAACAGSDERSLGMTSGETCGAPRGSTWPSFPGPPERGLSPAPMRRPVPSGIPAGHLAFAQFRGWPHDNQFNPGHLLRRCLARDPLCRVNAGALPPLAWPVSPRRFFRQPNSSSTIRLSSWCSLPASCPSCLRGSIADGALHHKHRPPCRQRTVCVDPGACVLRILSALPLRLFSSQFFPSHVCPPSVLFSPLRCVRLSTLSHPPISCGHPAVFLCPSLQAGN